MKKFFLFFLAFLFFVYSHGQVNNSNYYKTDKLSLGAGLGLNYGGIGGNLSFYPHESIGLFLGVGYAVKVPGLNAGFKLRFVNSNDFILKPYFMYMWGYNGLVQYKEDEDFYVSFGSTYSFGFETHMRPNGIGYFSFGVLFAQHRKSFDRITNNKANDILFSVGYHLCLVSRKKTIK